MWWMWTFDWLDREVHMDLMMSLTWSTNSAASSQASIPSLTMQYEWLVGTQYKPMELLKSDWMAVRKSPPWAIDSWGLGCLMYELFYGTKLSKTEDLRNTSALPKSLLPDYQRLLSSTPSRRLNPSKLDNSEYFQNKLVDTIQFMEVLNLKDSVEKDTFFRKLPNLAEQLPRQIVLKKLLPLLASALEFGSAHAPALTALLKMGSWLSAEEFNLKVLPTIIKLFASNDRAIRVSLLQHIEQFGASFTAQVVDEQVYPHVASGFSDTSAFLRELTLKSMLVLAPKLSQRSISGSLLKYLSKLQVDEEPAIRTNTTILLGNIANYLNDGTRKRVLINAFTVRALRDTFSPARAAGIMALSATSAYYDMTEIATRILPNIVVLTIDPDSDVRSKAFAAVDQFMQIARQHHEKMISADPSGTVSGIGGPLAAGNTSLLGWAMSSLTQKGKAEQAPVISSNSDKPIVSAASSTSLASDASDSMPRNVSYNSDMADQAAPSSPTSTDGWGELENGTAVEHESDKDGWDDIEPVDQKPPPALANIHAAQKRPVVPPKQQVTNIRLGSSVTATAKEEEDLWGAVAAPAPKTTAKPIQSKAVTSDDDDPWGAIAAPPPKTTAKPLQSKSTASNDDDPWAAIAAPAPSTRAKPLSAPRGRGGRAAPMKLGVQRINRSSSSDT